MDNINIDQELEETRQKARSACSAAWKAANAAFSKSRTAAYSAAESTYWTAHSAAHPARPADWASHSAAENRQEEIDYQINLILEVL